MGDYFNEITAEQAELIRLSRLFFVATADPTLGEGPHGIGPVNVSPRGGVPLHRVSPTRVAFVDFHGSGDEIARHSRAGGPVTVMVCSFDENAAIVRLYGKATATPFEASPLAEQLAQGIEGIIKHPRQVIEVQVERTSTSCGYRVPLMTFDHDRTVTERGKRFKPKLAGV